MIPDLWPLIEEWLGGERSLYAIFGEHYLALNPTATFRDIANAWDHGMSQAMRDGVSAPTKTKARRLLQTRREGRKLHQHLEREYRDAASAHDVACRHHESVCRAYQRGEATYAATGAAFHATAEAFDRRIAASRALYEAELS